MQSDYIPWTTEFHSERDILHDELIAELRRMSCTTRRASSRGLSWSQLRDASSSALRPFWQISPVRASASGENIGVLEDRLASFANYGTVVLKDLAPLETGRYSPVCCKDHFPDALIRRTGEPRCMGLWLNACRGQPWYLATNSVFGCLGLWPGRANFSNPNDSKVLAILVIDGSDKTFVLWSPRLAETECREGSLSRL